MACPRRRRRNSRGACPSPVRRPGRDCDRVMISILGDPTTHQKRQASQGCYITDHAGVAHDHLPQMSASPVLRGHVVVQKKVTVSIGIGNGELSSTLVGQRSLDSVGREGAATQWIVKVWQYETGSTDPASTRSFYPSGCRSKHHKADSFSSSEMCLSSLINSDTRACGKFMPARFANFSSRAASPTGFLGSPKATSTRF